MESENKSWIDPQARQIIEARVNNTLVVMDDPTKLPAVFRTLEAALPVATHLYQGRSTQEFSGDDLFKRAGGRYRKGEWMQKVVKQCRLEEGVHYRVVLKDINDPANAQEFMSTRGTPATTYFTKDAATKIIATSNTDEAMLLLSYLSALGDVATNRLTAQLTKVKDESKALERSLGDQRKKTEVLAERLGMPSTEMGVYNLQKIKALEAQIERLGSSQVMQAQMDALQRMHVDASKYMRRKKFPDKEFLAEYEKSLAEILDGNFGYAASFR